MAAILLEENAVRQHQASMIGTPQALTGEALRAAQRQVWHPKVIAKIWTYYMLKARAAGALSADTA